MNSLLSKGLFSSGKDFRTPTLVVNDFFLRSKNEWSILKNSLNHQLNTVLKGLSVPKSYSLPENAMSQIEDLPDLERVGPRSSVLMDQGGVTILGHRYYDSLVFQTFCRVKDVYEYVNAFERVPVINGPAIQWHIGRTIFFEAGCSKITKTAIRSFHSYAPSKFELARENSAVLRDNIAICMTDQAHFSILYSDDKKGPDFITSTFPRADLYRLKLLFYWNKLSKEYEQAEGLLSKAEELVQDVINGDNFISLSKLYQNKEHLEIILEKAKNESRQFVRNIEIARENFEMVLRDEMELRGHEDNLFWMFTRGHNAIYRKALETKQHVNEKIENIQFLYKRAEEKIKKERQKLPDYYSGPTFKDPFCACFDKFPPYERFLGFRAKQKKTSWDYWYFSAVREMVPHDRCHCERVYNILSSILAPLLNTNKDLLHDEELLCLMYAAFLHDVGMKGGYLSDKSGAKFRLDVNNYRQVRKFHGLLSAEEIRHYYHRFGLGRNEAELIAEVSKYHQRLRTLEDLSQTDSEAENKQRYKSIYVEDQERIIELLPPEEKETSAFTQEKHLFRIPLLTAILRVCDASDICRKRVYAYEDEDFLELWKDFISDRIKFETERIEWTTEIHVLEQNIRDIQAKLNDRASVLGVIDSQYMSLFKEAKRFLEDRKDEIRNSIGLRQFQNLEYLIYLILQPIHFKKHDAFRGVKVETDPSSKALSVKYESVGNVDQDTLKFVKDDLMGEWVHVQKFWKYIDIDKIKVEFV